MRIAYISEVYPSYFNDFWKSTPKTKVSSYAKALETLNADGFAWADYWVQALNNHGMPTVQFMANALPIQRKWAQEHFGWAHARLMHPHVILSRQIQEFRPDIVWLDSHDQRLAKVVRRSVLPSTKLVAWVGSALPHLDWSLYDGVLSCAQESVDRLTTLGVKAAQLHHAFSPSLLERPELKTTKKEGITFVGQFNPYAEFHGERERIISELTRSISMNIHAFVPETRSRIRRLFSSKVMPRFGKYANLCPAVFGIEMYKTLAESKAVLNIHADSSPKFSSNMRLFETTGVGALLITDWKQNIQELFEPEKEILTYRSVDECLKKMKWVENNPEAAEEIAQAGKRRCLSEHTFENRVLKLIKHFESFHRSA